MILKILRRRNRLTNDDHLAHQYLKEKVAGYLAELKKQNPTYFLAVQRNCKIGPIDKHRAYSLSFELQELAEDLTNVIFGEEEDLKIYCKSLNTINKKASIKFPSLICNLIKIEIKNQLLNKEEFSLDIVEMNRMQRCNIVSILSNLKNKIT